MSESKLSTEDAVRIIRGNFPVDKLILCEALIVAIEALQEVGQLRADREVEKKQHSCVGCKYSFNYNTQKCPTCRRCYWETETDNYEV